jgi:hypothetical protein
VRNINYSFILIYDFYINYFPIFRIFNRFKAISYSVQFNVYIMNSCRVVSAINEQCQWSMKTSKVSVLCKRLLVMAEEKPWNIWISVMRTVYRFCVRILTGGRVIYPDFGVWQREVFMRITVGWHFPQHFYEFFPSKLL